MQHFPTNVCTGIDASDASEALELHALKVAAALNQVHTPPVKEHCMHGKAWKAACDTPVPLPTALFNSLLVMSEQGFCDLRLFFDVVFQQSF